MNDKVPSVVVTSSLIKKLEWSSYQQGPGSGPMFSGGDGAWIPACPLCGGIKDSEWAGSGFNDTVRGHRPTCELGIIAKHVREHDYNWRPAESIDEEVEGD